MSGFKHAYVSISEAEYRRLHETDMKNRFSSLPSHTSAFEPARLDAIERMLSQFTLRQDEFQDCIGILGSEIGEMEASNVQDLLDYTDTSFQELAAGTEALKQQMLEREDNLLHEISSDMEAARNDSVLIIQEYAERLNAKIKAIRRQQAGQLAGIQQQFVKYSNEMEDRQAFARYWLDSASAIREFIERDYDHRRFLPGAFDALDFQLKQAVENLAAKMPEAALASAQHVYAECSLKRLELEEVTTRWQATYLRVLQSADELLEEIVACQTIPAIDTSGKELDIKIDLDKWTGQTYLELKKEALILRSSLSTGASKLTISDMDAILSSRIPDIRQDLSRLIYKARWEVVNSQLRINIADLAVLALERQGYHVQEHGFKDSNMKDGYCISLSSVDGNQVVIQVNPLPDAEGGTDFVIESKDSEKRTESEMRSRSLEITRSLARFGLRVGPLSTNQDLAVGKMKNPPIQKTRIDKHERLSRN